MAKRARRAGLAALLVSALVADVCLRGVESLVLRTESAAGYFSRLGFTPVDRAAIPDELLASHEFSDIGPHTGTVMKVEL